MFPHKRVASGNYEHEALPSPPTYSSEISTSRPSNPRAARSKSNIRSHLIQEVEREAALYSRGKEFKDVTSNLAKHRATSPLVNMLGPEIVPESGNYEFNPTIFPSPP